MYKFRIIIGDHSCDGHCKTYSQLVECNMNVDDLKNLYKITKKIVGAAPGDYCKEWQDNTITHDQLEKMGILEVLLKEWELDKEDLDHDYYNEDYMSMLILYLKHHNTDLYLRKVNEVKWETGFGYGVCD